MHTERDPFWSLSAGEGLHKYSPKLTQKPSNFGSFVAPGQSGMIQSFSVFVPRQRLTLNPKPVIDWGRERLWFELMLGTTLSSWLDDLSG